MDRPLEGDLGVATRPRQSVPGSRAQQGRRLRLPEKSSSPIRSHPCLCWGCHSAADTGSDCSPTDAATPHLKPKTLVNVIGLNLKLASLRTPEKWGVGSQRPAGPRAWVWGWAGGPHSPSAQLPWPYVCGQIMWEANAGAEETLLTPPLPTDCLLSPTGRLLPIGLSGKYGCWAFS